ncbi:alginate lyase family protein [Prosthecobacter sp. SYSU 5D2]|uniref:heparinase II/III family protein n=1 Tax=Prosthecobacter sp. SYSU 5D2 TaxID=3134134 RepID=UPI0031FF2C90
MKAPKSIAWYAHRLRAMTPAEITHRLTEHWNQQTQPAFLKKLEGFDPGPPADRQPRLPEKAAASMSLRAHLADNARKLQAGRWQLFGWRNVDVGSPPCWHRDAACGVVIDPDKPAHRLNHRQLPDGADARTIWELNRWAEMTRLAMHGWLNDDVAAIRTAQLWLEDWTVRNPPGMGINWTSPLEAALRLINFTWFDALVRAQGNPALLKAQDALVRSIVPVHAAWIWRYRSAGSSANNHLLGELAALVVAVSRWPALAAIACPAETAWDLLGHEVLHQFAPDGGSREQALHYHLFAFDLAWLAARTVGCRAGDVHDRLATAAGYFQALAHGPEPWDFGDNDDAQVLPLTQDRSQAAQEWLRWFQGGENALHYWLGSRPGHPSTNPGRHFPFSGMAVMHEDGWKVRLDASPLGFGALAAHGHGDALHLSLWDGDEALLIDPGTGGYYGHPQWRIALAAWDSHNGPLPSSGFKTPKRLGPFLWSRHHPVPKLALEGRTLLAQFDHEAHSFQRTVRFLNHGIQITDLEAARQPFKLRLVFSPKCRLIPASPGTAGDYVISRGSHSWDLAVQGKGLNISLAEMAVSSAYGSTTPAPALSIEVASGDLTWLLKRRSEITQGGQA